MKMVTTHEKILKFEDNLDPRQTVLAQHVSHFKVVKICKYENKSLFIKKNLKIVKTHVKQLKMQDNLDQARSTVSSSLLTVPKRQLFISY